MRTHKQVYLHGIFILVLMLILTTPSWGSDDLGLATKGQALGNKVAGSYLLDFTPDGPLASFRGLMSIHSDGSLILTETTDFGFGDPTVFGFNSPSHGAWKKTGRREIGSKMLFFNYTEDGTPEVIIRVETSWEFIPGFDSFSGTYSLNVFTLSQDPLDPNEVPVAVLSGVMSGQRIEF